MTDQTVLMATPDPPALVLWERTYPGVVEQLRNVRADVRKHLDGCAVTDDVVVLISELSANAILHSSSGQPDSTFTVRIVDFPGACVYAEIEDGGSAWHGDLARSAEPLHGLHFMQMLATTCGTNLCVRAHVVWFTITYPQDATAPAGFPQVPAALFPVSALRASFPEFTFRMIDIAGKRSIEAIRVSGTGTLYAVITSDPAEVWRIVRLGSRSTHGRA